MGDFEDHEVNGTAVDGFSADDNGGRGGEIEDHTDSKSQRETRDHERESSRSKNREREKDRDKDSERSRDRDVDKSKERSREKDRDRDRERHHRSNRHRDHSRERSERRERGSRDDDDYRRSRDRDYDRRRDDRGDKRRRRSRSRSKDRSERRSRSRSPSKSKRVSGSDMVPPASAMLAAGGATVTVMESSSSTNFLGSFGPRFDLPISALDASKEYCHRLKTIYEAPTRRLQPLLHPFRENGSLWIGIDDSVTNFIKHTWQENFGGPWKNWSEVKKNAPEKIQAWWGTFVQNYNWDPRFEDIVFYSWKEKTMKGIREEISRKKRQSKKPNYISEDDWAFLMEEWQIKKTISKSQSTASRKTKIDDKEMHKHTVGSNSFANIEYGMMQKVQGSEPPPPILDLVKTVHTRADCTDVDQDQVVEGLVKEVEDAATQLQNSSGTVGSTSGPSRKIINQLYVEQAKPCYKHLYGACSVVKYPNDIKEDIGGRINDIKSKLESIEKKIDMIVDILFGGQK